MSHEFKLEFYVPKSRADREYVGSLARLLEAQGFTLTIDSTHAPYFGDMSQWTQEECARLSAAEALDRLVAVGGGGLPFLSKSMALWLSIYPMGWYGNMQRAKRLGESATGEVPLGSVAIDWPWVSDEHDTRPRLRKTVELGHAFYAALNPVLGMGYLDEVDVTEASVLRDGPRYVFPINFWSPEMVRKVDFSALRNVPGLIVEDLPDGGVLICRDFDRPGREWIDLTEVGRLLRRS